MSATARMYLLGAGFSMAISAGLPRPHTMPGMQDLSEGVLAYLNRTYPRRLISTDAEVATAEALKKLANDVGISDHLFTIQATADAVREMALANAFPGIGTPLVKNFEQWLSYLIESPPWLTPADQARNRAAFLDIAEAVGRVLESCQRAVIDMQKEKCPKWLADLVRYWEAEGARVFTFNYDRLVELAWLVNTERGGRRESSWDLYPVPVTPLITRSGRRTPAVVHCVPGEFQLFKLHGSLGWWYTGPDGPPNDIIYDQGMEGHSWSLDGLAPIGEPPYSLMEDREQMIVPPAAVKSPYYNNSALRAMWRNAAANLTIADELVIMGFSLPATDMLVSSMLCTNVQKDCKITPVDFDDAIVERICTVFNIKPDDQRLNLDYVKLGKEAIPRWVAENVRA